ncbi:MAG: hypothetical protein OEY14_14395 [Myxococcales bacterium]|nr:hypothetical protein [Myxococcales bacterium]
MHSNIQDQMHELEELRLPELQARFAEIVGEPRRTPNKQYLLRRIAEALEAKQTEGRTESDNAGEHTDHDDVTTEPESTDSDDAGEPTTTTDLADIKLTKLTIPELQGRYRQTIGRDTRSTSAAYLQWKIRQAAEIRPRLTGSPRSVRRDRRTSLIATGRAVMAMPAAFVDRTRETRPAIARGRLSASPTAPRCAAALVAVAHSCVRPPIRPALLQHDRSERPPLRASWRRPIPLRPRRPPFAPAEPRLAADACPLNHGRIC